MKKFALITAVCLAALATVAYARDKIHGDFVYDGIGPDVLPLNLMLLQLRTGLLSGDRQGLAKVSAIPAAPASGVTAFDLSGVGPVTEDPDGIVVTACGQPVTTWDGGASYSTVAVDGGTAVRCMTQSSAVTETDGGATYTFAIPFNALPTCWATSTAAAAHAINVNTPTYTTVNVAGTVNTNDVVNVICTGYR